MNNTIIIGIDHGYGNIKTTNCCFKTGVEVFAKEPTFKSNLLTFNGKFYTIGGTHKEFINKKEQDEDFYVLTLVAIAREMKVRQISTGKIHLAVGLPLTWLSEQKESFKTYLMRKNHEMVSKNMKILSKRYLLTSSVPGLSSLVVGILGEIQLYFTSAIKKKPRVRVKFYMKIPSESMGGTRGELVPAREAGFSAKSEENFLLSRRK